MIIIQYLYFCLSLSPASVSVCHPILFLTLLCSLSSSPLSPHSVCLSHSLVLPPTFRSPLSLPLHLRHKLFSPLSLSHFLSLSLSFSLTFFLSRSLSLSLSFFSLVCLFSLSLKDINLHVMLLRLVDTI